MEKASYELSENYPKRFVKRLKTDIILIYNRLTETAIVEIDAMWRLSNCYQ